jgi:glycosidase
MRHTIILLISIVTTLISSIYSSGSIASNELYISLDQYGNKVFSDKKPQSGKYETQQQRAIPTVIWHKSISYPKAKQKRKRSKPMPSKSDKQQDCQKLLNEMSSLEKQLEYKQKASQFDLYKKKLRTVRWQYQTKC